MAKERSKRKIAVIAACIFTGIIVLVPFLCVLIAGLWIPPQYADTFYGELAPMYAKMARTRRNKIVILGNSAVAFGVDSALAQRLLSEGGLDYAVCPFGLYGALGTKMMCELALSQIGEGDIVVFTPELYEQSLSTYFSAEEAWYALDSETGLYWKFSSETQNALLGGYFGYTAKKLQRFQSGERAEGSGVYAKSSFDENCDLKNYPRPYNVMEGGADSNNPVSFDKARWSKEFLSYCNEFAKKVTGKGARIFYSFAPMNASAVSFEELKKAESLYDFLFDALEFPIIGKIEDSILEREWFYDSNYHLNESGMTVHTVQLVNDIKTELGNSTKTQCALPEKPVIPDQGVVGEGDNSDAAMFEYRLDGSYYTVVGLTEAGKAATELVIPYQVDGVYVKAFLPLVFFNDKKIAKITVQENIHTLSNGCFVGCDGLKEIVLKHTEPAEIAVGYELLNGTNGCKISVPQSALSKFENNYFWGRYARQLQGY